MNDKSVKRLEQVRGNVKLFSPSSLNLPFPQVTTGERAIPEPRTQRVFLLCIPGGLQAYSTASWQAWVIEQQTNPGSR
jgi:hypothetical protein